MRSRAARFEIDREERKFLGVCAGLANRTGIDVTIVRIAVVLMALLVSFKAVVILYLGAALVGSRGSWGGRCRTRIDSGETNERMRSHEQRMQAIDTYVAGSNSRLAREIEELR